MNEPTQQVTCATCRFFRPDPGTPRGECWLNPPTPFANGERKRPTMRATEWCGRHEAGTPAERGKVHYESGTGWTDRQPSKVDREARKNKAAAQPAKV